MATTTDQQRKPGESGGETATDATAEEAPAAPATLDRDVVFTVLKNWRRREVLRHLEEAESLDVGDLAERIAAEENDTTREALTSQQRKRVYVSLYQCHLPMMADAGVVEYERSRGTVRPTPATERVANYLDEDPSWWRYYLGVAAAGATVYGVAALAVPGAGWLQVLTVAALVAGVVGVALAQWRRTRSEAA